MPTKRKATAGTRKKRAAVSKKRGPIPVAEAGDLPKDALVVSLDFAKKHWGKAALSAGALGLAGAGGALVNQALKNAKERTTRKSNMDALNYMEQEVVNNPLLRGKAPRSHSVGVSTNEYTGNEGF